MADTFCCCCCWEIHEVREGLWVFSRLLFPGDDWMGRANSDPTVTTKKETLKYRRLQIVVSLVGSSAQCDNSDANCNKQTRSCHTGTHVSVKLGSLVASTSHFKHEVKRSWWLIFLPTETPFPNCLLPLFQSESQCKTFHMN